MSLIDGFFPVVPSDAVLVGSATAWQQSGNGFLEWGNPLLWLILLSAIAGGWCGDQIAYLIGSKVDVRKLRIFRNPRGQATLDWTEHALEKRGTAFIIAGRFIPWGRIAVNLSAGALKFPHRRFMGVDLVGVSLWATWSVALGTVAGSIFDDNLLLSIAIGVVGGIALGLLVDKILALVGLAPVEIPDHQPELNPASGKPARKPAARD